MTINNQDIYPNENDEHVDENYENYNFTMIPNEFIFAYFDPYTIAYFNIIIARAQNNKKGFYEYHKTTSKNSGISISKIKQCAALLKFCNIIKIETIYNPNNPNLILRNKITIIKKDKWNLNHE